MRTVGLCLLLVALLLASSSARADKDKDLAAAKVHLQKGQELLKRRMHRAAIVEFQAAYDASEQPNMLFNIGEVYRTLAERSDGTPEDARKAADYLRQFLVERPEDPERAVIQQHIAALEARAGIVAPRSPVASGPPKKASVIVPPPAPAASGPSLPVQPGPALSARSDSAPGPIRPGPALSAQSDSAPGGDGRPIGLEVALGGGMAIGLAAAGLGAYALAVDGQPGCTLTAPALHCPQLVDSTLLGAVLVSAGAAVAIGSLVGLIVVERRARSGERRADAIRLTTVRAALSRDALLVGAGGAW